MKHKRDAAGPMVGLGGGWVEWVKDGWRSVRHGSCSAWALARLYFLALTPAGTGQLGTTSNLGQAATTALAAACQQGPQQAKTRQRQTRKPGLVCQKQASAQVAVRKPLATPSNHCLMPCTELRRVPFRCTPGITHHYYIYKHADATTSTDANTSTAIPLDHQHTTASSSELNGAAEQQHAPTRIAVQQHTVLPMLLIDSTQMPTLQNTALQTAVHAKLPD